MRRRLQKFLPIVLVAVLVQIFAPIGATWAASIAASDPLHAAAICHGGAGSVPGQSDPSDQPRAHDGCCSVCSVVHSAALDAPQATVVAPARRAERVTWSGATPDLSRSRAGSPAQPRAPPAFS
jgi:hypothetical protein